MKVDRFARKTFFPKKNTEKQASFVFADLEKSAQMLQNSEKSGPVLLRVGVEVALFPGHR